MPGCCGDLQRFNLKSAKTKAPTLNQKLVKQLPASPMNDAILNGTSEVVMNGQETKLPAFIIEAHARRKAAALGASARAVRAPAAAGVVGSPEPFAGAPSASLAGCKTHLREFLDGITEWTCTQLE